MSASQIRVTKSLSAKNLEYDNRLRRPMFIFPVRFIKKQNSLSNLIENNIQIQDFTTE